MAATEKYLLIMTTCPDMPAAEKIASELVDNSLAACVQLLPGIRSFFRWQGKVERADEILLLIKTTAQRYAEIENIINSLHSYEVPEIIAVPVTAGLRDYLNWIDDNTRAL
jgi:periplasmic divalent cation tolerance protein